MKKFFWAVLAAMFLAAVASPAFAQASDNPAGHWRGVWTNETGFIFDADMTLEKGSDGSLRGKIVWVLKKVGTNASEAYAKKAGLSGTEYVKGELKGPGFLVFNGYDKDDPNQILGLDKYRLALSEDGKVMGGITWNNGPWTGQYLVKRVE